MRERRLAGAAGRAPRRTPTGAGSTSPASQLHRARRHAHRSPADAPLRRAGRRQPRGSRRSRKCRCRRPVEPGETHHAAARLDRRTCRAPSRAPAWSATSTSSAQWFPKIGVLEDDGWNCHQFHAATEFFSDFGVYDVRLTVPTGWIVGATGVEQERRDERRRHARRTTTTPQDVHDFAWTTSPDYVERTATLRATRRCRRWRCGCCCSRSTSSQAERHFAATRADAPALRRMVRPLSLPPDHHRRSGVAERRRRHGVPDPDHRRHTLAGAARAGGARRRSPSTRPATSSGTAWSPPTSSSTRGWTKGSTPTRPAARSRRVRRPLFFAKRYFGDFVPWTLRDCAARACPRTRTGWPATPPSRTATRPPRRASATGRKRAGVDDLQQDRRCGWTRSNVCSAGRRCSGSCPPTSRASRSSTRSPRTSSRW